MNAERWRQVDKILQEAIEREAGERAVFLDRACAGDSSLRKEIEALIHSFETAGNFLESPAVDATPVLSTGQVIGSYEVGPLLGSGGMGTVYRARDSRLKRDVALKVLPTEFARDPERISRFQREAEVLASLNHPHIEAIYELEKFGESRFLVLELVEGETLADRLTRGPIEMDESLRIAKQIAEALEAAHEKGIIHRDLKPANIKIAPEGSVKVLDFGLAKMGERQGGGASLSNSPTAITASAPGMILGTAAYMSPEQAAGKEADRTSDVWAFGCVLYEMLSGRRLFEGETVSGILAGVLKAEPDWHRLPAGTPEGIRRLLRRCLRKESKFRLRDIRDAWLEIDEAQNGPQIDGHVLQDAARRRSRLAWISAISALAVVTLIAGVLGVLALRRPIPPASETRTEITAPNTYEPGARTSFAVSPDGQKIAYVASSEGRLKLWLRSLDSVTARPMAGTDGASYPFWSPDSRSVGFFADIKLKRIDRDRYSRWGTPQRVRVARGTATV